MVLTSSTHSLKGKAWWEKLSLGYWLTLKYSNQLQGEAAFSKGTWEFCIGEILKLMKLAFITIIIINLAFWSIFYLSLSKLVVSTPCCTAMPWKHHGKAVFSLYIPQLVGEEGSAETPAQWWATYYDLDHEKST